MLPFLLKPYLRKVIWGGSALETFKGLPADLDHIGESWEVSAMPGHESVVASGPMTGQSLSEVCRRHGAELMGREVQEQTGGEFPLLIKYIDAEDNLSVQVHPDDRLAQMRHDSRGKCEMWYVLASRPGSLIGAGLHTPITPDEFSRRAADGTLADTLAWYSTAPGDVFYLPAGRVHAIGAGNFLVEVQQASDITYRIYDYGRHDADGRLRELHVDEAREAIDFSATESCRVKTDGRNLISSEHFTVRRHDLGDAPLEINNPSFTAVMCISGDASAACGGTVLDIPAGHTMLIPASTPTRITGHGAVITVTP